MSKPASGLKNEQCRDEPRCINKNTKILQKDKRVKDY